VATHSGLKDGLSRNFPSPRCVPACVKRAPERLIVCGCGLFIFILWLSAYFQADIRWLHFFQALMYVATLWLALHRNRWGYFIGISAAGLWDFSGLFVNNFVMSGLRWLMAWIHSGQLKHVDQIIAIPAFTGNFLVLAGCLWGTRGCRKSLCPIACASLLPSSSARDSSPLRWLFSSHAI